MVSYQLRMFPDKWSLYTWLFMGVDTFLSCAEGMEESTSRFVPRWVGTTDTSGDETEGREPRRKVRFKWTSKVKKVWMAEEVGRFFVTGRYKESTLSKKTSSWTVLVRLTYVSSYLRSFRRWPKHCVWAEATNLSTSSGPNSLSSPKVNVDVTWSQDEVLVSILPVPSST